MTRGSGTVAALVVVAVVVDVCKSLPVVELELLVVLLPVELVLEEVLDVLFVALAVAAACTLAWTTTTGLIYVA